MGHLTRLLCSRTVLMALAVACGACSTSISDESLTRIDADAVSARLAGEAAGRTLVVDSRPATVYRAGHIPSSVNLRLEDVARGRTHGLADYPMIVVYGQNPSSATAIALAKRLTTLGYRGVRLYAGGYDAWVRAGLPIASDE